MIDPLHDAYCEKSFVETPSGAQLDRPELNAAFNLVRSGDTLVVRKRQA